MMKRAECADSRSLLVAPLPAGYSSDWNRSETQQQCEDTVHRF